jgi:hypothetical protein
MKFIIDRKIKGSYSEKVTYEESNDFSWMRKEKYDEERIEKWKSKYVETGGEIVKGWIDGDGICHRIRKETIKFIEVNTLDELYAITKDNGGRIVFGTNRGHEGADGWIEIYDDYRE